MQSAQTQKKKKIIVSHASHRETLKASKNPLVEKLKKSSPKKEKTSNPSMSKSKRYNEEFITVLDELSDLIRRRGEAHRAIAYQNAAQTIIKFSDDITDPVTQLKGLPGIGPTILNKLNEYVKTGKITALEKERANPLNILAEPFGIGTAKAKELVAAGITSIEELRKQQDLLNDKQKIGLKYLEDIRKRIPRAEIDKFSKTFTKIFESVAPPGSKFEIAGSYRRGAKNSGDIDIIITNKENNKAAFDKVLDVLIKDKIITEVLSRGKTKSLTLVQIDKDSPIRRVDFMYSSPDEYAFALFYFTGSKIFNTVVRQRALDLGYTLNEHGLSHFAKGVKGKKVDHDFPTEQSIMNFLGLKYIKPEDRIDGRSVVILKESTDKEKSSVEVSPIDEEMLEAALEALEKDKSPEKDTIPTDEEMLEEALEALEKQEKSPKKFTPTKKNVTLKKSASQTPNLVKKFKDEGLSALKVMTETDLSDILQKANQAYYCDDKPIFTDNEYDILREYVLTKYPKNEAAKEGHTKCSVEMEKTKVKLPYEMWSMDKIKPTTDAVVKWTKKYKGPYVISAKLDGVSALYVAEEGKEPKLYTRGNGTYGQDISPLIPHLIREKTEGSMVIRGEIIIAKKVFEEKYATKFANSRNFVAGIINRKTADASVIKDLDFVPYEVIEPEFKPVEQMMFLDELWTTPSSPKTVKYEVLDEISNEVLSELLLDWRESYKYEIDGIIVVNDKIYPRPKGNPEYAFAFKMMISDQVAEVKVVDIIWTPSKDGYLVPRVQIEPIVLSGAKIEYATGFNAKFIEDNKIGVGALISIVRSGEVIPHILGTVVPAEKPLMPTQEYKWDETHKNILLVDKDDDETVREKNIAGFFKNIEVDGLGPGNIKRMIEAGFDSVPKILAMTKSDYLKVQGFKDKTASKLYAGIQDKLDKASLAELMTASNAFGRGFGDKRFTAILDVYPDILITGEDKKAKIAKLVKVEGVADKTAERFVEAIPAFLEFMEAANLENKLSEKKASKKVQDTSHPLYGKKIVFTGGKDKVLIEELLKVGAEVASSVSKNTFVVIAKSQDEDTGKADAARKLNIPIMTVAEFRKEYM